MLENYNKKRDFNKTKEPEGKVCKDNKNRFVIQHHFSRKEHYDFRLEYRGVLVSFAVPKGLSNKQNEKRLAVHVEDHPVDYIDFEGKIPSGNYGAGIVEVFDNGYYEPLTSFKEGIKKGHIKIRLRGKIYQGVWSLIRMDEPNWLIIKDRDKESKKIKNPFSSCDVKLAKLSEIIPSKNYIFEIKYDGYRIIAFCAATINLKTRNNNDFTDKFPSIVDSLETIKRTMVLDGEMVSFDNNGRSNFSLLTQNIKSNSNSFCYVVFDILALDGKDLRNKPLLERKELLKESLKEAPSNIILSNYVFNKGKESFALAKKLKLEGIVAKKIDSKYNDKRDEDWLKIKCYKRQEFVIGGFLTTEKNTKLSAILVGYYEGGDLIFAGKVGTGFSMQIRNELAKVFKKSIRKTMPFKECNVKGAKWIKPQFVAEIQFSEITKNSLLRQPSFVGLRLDKEAKKVRLEYEK